MALLPLNPCKQVQPLPMGEMRARMQVIETPSLAMATEDPGGDLAGLVHAEASNGSARQSTWNMVYFGIMVEVDVVGG